MLELAIDDLEYGPRIRESRILRPDEVQKVAVLKKVRELVEKANRLDKELAARLEAAMDAPSEFEKLAKNWLGEEEYLRMGYWPEEESFRQLDEAAALIEFVIATYRPELRPFRIEHLFQERVPPANRRIRLGTAMKLPGKMAHLSQIHAVITLAFGEWRFLTDRDRQRLVHHELSHLVVIDGGLAVQGHDFEDFGSIVALYGLRSESGRMNMDGRVAEALKKAVGSQLELAAPGAD
jgi:hypothetical protein